MKTSLLNKGTSFPFCLYKPKDYQCVNQKWDSDFSYLCEQFLEHVCIIWSSSESQHEPRARHFLMLTTQWTKHVLTVNKARGLGSNI